MDIDIKGNKYNIRFASDFKKDLKKVKKRGKDQDKLKKVVELLAKGESLPEKYRDHSLYNDRIYKNCRECHIEPDWLLVYKYFNDELILLLVSTGRHQDVFSNSY